MSNHTYKLYDLLQEKDDITYPPVQTPTSTVEIKRKGEYMTFPYKPKQESHMEYELENLLDEYSSPDYLQFSPRPKLKGICPKQHGH